MERPKPKTMTVRTSKAKHAESRLARKILQGPRDAVEMLAEQLAALTLEPTKTCTLEPITTSSRTDDTKTFICFGDLPTELRLLIWRHSRPEPRFIPLAQSKIRQYGYSGAFPGVYSRAPIPAMLHACSESRQVALSWYQLAFSTHSWVAPLVYFDFSADYLYTGCTESCEPLTCSTCFYIFRNPDVARVQRLLFSLPGRFDPFFELYVYFLSVKEVLLFNPKTSSLTQGSRLSDLRETKERFEWQYGEMDLHEMMLEHREDSRLKGLDELRTYHYPVVSVPPEKITRVEIAVTPETSRNYGFMKKEFSNTRIDFSFR